MFTKAFWKDASERAVKTAAQFALVALGVDGAGLASLNWTVTGISIAGAVLASFVTSVISAATPPGQIGPSPQNPSLDEKVSGDLF